MLLSQKVNGNLRSNEGVKGMLPLGCFPLWGREGVTLTSVTKEKRL
jgi:hypothetical protein